MAHMALRTDRIGVDIREGVLCGHSIPTEPCAVVSVCGIPSKDAEGGSQHSRTQYWVMAPSVWPWRLLAGGSTPSPEAWTLWPAAWTVCLWSTSSVHLTWSPADHIIPAGNGVWSNTQPAQSVAQQNPKMRMCVKGGNFPHTQRQ